MGKALRALPWLTAACLFLPYVAFAQSSQERASVNSSAEQVIEEVVVTARRREESLQESPVSVSALSERFLQENGIRSFEEFAASVPGLSFVGNGSPENKIVIRGVSTGVVTRSEGAVVGLYIDDVPVGSRRFNPNPRLYDIDRVEVLRGPQGTLFGEGSIGGTIRWIPKKPDLSELGASFEVGASDTEKGSGAYEVAAVANIPLLRDQLGVRIAAYSLEESGFVDNPTLGLNDVNEAQVDGARLTLKYEPTQAFTLGLMYFRQEKDMPGKPQYDPDLGDLLQERNFEEALGDDFELASVTLRYDFDSMALDSSTAWLERSVANLRDITPLIGLPTYLDDITEFENFVQEIRLSSNRPLLDGKLNWLVGVFFSQNDEYFNQDIYARGLGDLFDSDNYLDKEQLAVFGEMEFALNEQLEAIVGVRWFDITQDGLSLNAGLVAGLPPGVVDRQDVAAEESGFSPKFGLSYRLPEGRGLLFATASRGFREGGPTGQGVPPDPATGAAAPTEYDADQLWNYEIGLKSNWLDSRLQFNGAVYYIDWEDIQTTNIRSDGHTFTINAGGARSWGLEVEAQALLGGGWMFTGSASYVDSTLTEDQRPPGDGKKGDRIPGVPDWTYSANLRYERELVSDLSLFLNFGYQHVGDSYNGFGVATGTSSSSAERQDAYDLVRLRAGLTADKWEITAYAHNLTDERAVLFLNRIVGDVRVNTIAPRTLGLSLRYLLR